MLGGPATLGLMPLVRTRSLPFAILALILAGACQRQNPDPAANQTETPADGENNIAEVLPLPAPAMDRAAFLAAVARAASAHTAGTDDASSQSELDGRRFAIRMRFGCAGPAVSGSGEPLRWSVSKDKASFEVRATPDLSLDSEPFEGSLGETIEAVEGFWLARPWLMSDACPAQRAGVSATTATAGKLVGIAQYFTSEDSRVGQRSGRSYVSVEKIASEGELPKSGLVLLLEGRLRTWPGGKVIRCWGAGSASPPQCVAAARLDRAAFERPEDGSVLAEWRN